MQSASPAPVGRRSSVLWCLVLSGLLTAAVTFAITWGTVSIAPGTVWRIAAAQLLQVAGFDLVLEPTWSVQQFQIVWMIRMPRVLLAALVGAGLAVVGITSLITLTSGQRELAAALMTWTLGTLAGTEWKELGLPALVLGSSLAWLLLQARALNALGSGEETAVTLGVHTHGLRRRLFVMVSLLTGTMVAVSGAIGFIGLVIPHITRMLVGVNHRRVLPVAALGGAIFLVLVDLLARTWLAPTELPAGVVTSLIGGPFFVWMLLRHTGFGGRTA